MLEKEDLKQIKELIDTSLDVKLAPVKKQLSNVEEKVEVLEPMKLRLSEIEAQLENLEPMKLQLSGIETRLDSMELEIKEIRMNLDKLSRAEDEDVVGAYKDIDNLRRRIDNLEMKLNKMQSARA